MSQFYSEAFVTQHNNVNSDFQMKQLQKRIEHLQSENSHLQEKFQEKLKDENLKIQIRYSQDQEREREHQRQIQGLQNLLQDTYE